MAEVITIVASLLSIFIVMGTHFNFYTHVIFPKTLNTNCSPDGLMVRHPFLEVSHHSIKSLVIQRKVVRVDPEDLGPALPTSVLQCQVYIYESLIDLSIGFGINLSSLRIPSAYGRLEDGHSYIYPSLALSCALYAVSDTDGLVVPELLALLLSKWLVSVILQMRHDGRISARSKMRCAEARRSLLLDLL